MNLLESTIDAITPQSPEWRDRARLRLDQLTMPHWALGRLMDLALDLAGMTRTLDPPVARRAVVVMAGDHGITEEGVSLYPREVTAQMVLNFVRGGAGISALAATAGARVFVVDMGVATELPALAALAQDGKIVSKRIAAGTRNFAHEPAMTREEARRAIEAGMEVAASLCDEVDLIGTGDMGIGNTTPSSAIVALLCQRGVGEVTGRGTGLGDEARTHKAEVIERALALHQPDAFDAIDILSKVGGFEIAGIAGLILGAAARRKPVLVDGFISTAGALLAHLLAPASREYMIAAHRSAEPGHRYALTHLGVDPLLDLGLRLGEGTGAALAMPLAAAAAAVLTRVATFADAGVSTASAEALDAPAAEPHA